MFIEYQHNLYIKRGDSAVSDGTAGGSGQGKPRVESKARELLGLGGLELRCGSGGTHLAGDMERGRGDGRRAWRKIRSRSLLQVSRVEHTRRGW